MLPKTGFYDNGCGISHTAINIYIYTPEFLLDFRPQIWTNLLNHIHIKKKSLVWFCWQVILTISNLNASTPIMSVITDQIFLLISFFIWSAQWRGSVTYYFIKATKTLDKSYLSYSNYSGTSSSSPPLLGSSKVNRIHVGISPLSLVLENHLQVINFPIHFSTYF